VEKKKNPSRYEANFVGNFNCEKGVKKNKKACSKTDFLNYQSEIQCNYYKTNGYNTYKIGLDKLRELSKMHNWINEFDEFSEIIEDDDDPLDKNIMSEPEEISQNPTIAYLEAKVKELEAKITRNVRNSYSRFRY
jgi:hypothetical protein